jgi:hypothetical protein
MRLPRPRFTIRRMMVAVAIIAVLLARTVIEQRKEKYFNISMRHFDKVVQVETGYMPEPAIGWVKYHRQLGDKYYAAHNRPWLPVGPDPPEPK